MLFLAKKIELNLSFSWIRNEMKGPLATCAGRKPSEELSVILECRAVELAT